MFFSRPLPVLAAVLCLAAALFRPVSAGAQTSLAGTYDNQTITGDVLFPGGGQSPVFLNGTTWTGTNATFDAPSQLGWDQTGVLDGKVIQFNGASGQATTIALLAGASLTFGPGTTASGTYFAIGGTTGAAFVNQGVVTMTGGAGSIFTDSIENYGTIQATGGSTLYYNNGAANRSLNATGAVLEASGTGSILSALNVDNQGTMAARNGGLLRFDSAWATGQLGNVTVDATSRALFGYTLDNTGETLAGPTGGYYELDPNAIVTNGTIAAGALLFTPTGGGTLDHVTYTGDLTVTGTTATLVNGSTFTGSNLVITGGGTLNWAPSAAVESKALIVGDANGNGTLHFTTAATLGAGTTLRGSGTVTGDVTLDGAVLAPGNSVGNLTFANGAFTVAGASTLQLELSGTTVDEVWFASPGSIDLGHGLLAVSLTLLTAPQFNHDYTFMKITAGNGTIFGELAGLAQTGDTFSATFGSDTYVFEIDYQANAVSFKAVPEPATVWLLGAGGALIVAWQRRSRFRRLA